MNWYLKVMRNYAQFNGRAGRTEYWMFILVNCLFFIVAMIIDNVAHTTIHGMFYGLFYILYALAIFIPHLSVGVRRLHDIGKSGMWMFLMLIPFLGVIWLLVLMLFDSVPGENQYGPNPKEVVA